MALAVHAKLPTNTLLVVCTHHVCDSAKEGEGRAWVRTEYGYYVHRHTGVPTAAHTRSDALKLYLLK